MDEKVRDAGMGTNSTVVYAQEVAENLQSDFQRDSKEAGGRGTRGGALYLVNGIETLVRFFISFFMLKMLLQPGDDGGLGGCKSTVDSVLDPLLDSPLGSRSHLEWKEECTKMT